MIITDETKSWSSYRHTLIYKNYKIAVESQLKGGGLPGQVVLQTRVLLEGTYQGKKSPLEEIAEKAKIILHVEEEEINSKPEFQDRDQRELHLKKFTKVYNNADVYLANMNKALNEALARMYKKS